MTPMEDFNWVQEQAHCSLSAVFELLRQQVSQDVKERQGIRKPIKDIAERPGYDHSFTFSESRGSFTVVLEGPHLHERVSFLLEPHSIKVTNSNGEEVLSAVPSLNAEGKCIVKIGKQEYPLWYMRKLALEDLFFRVVAP